MQESQYASAGSLHTMVCLPFFFEQIPVFEKESYNQQIENFPLNVGFESNWVSKLLFLTLRFLKRNPITRRFHKWGCLKIGMLETFSFWLKTNMFEHRYFETFPNNGVPNPSFDTGIPLKCVRQVQSSLAC